MTKQPEKFVGHYLSWRKARIQKLVSILGKGWFKGKTVLEMACGYGHIGREIQAFGATVSFADGDPEHVKMAAELNADIPGSEFIVIDQDKPWHFPKRFDLLIYWGILYHLNDWRADLKRAIRHGDIIALETEVMDSENIQELKVDENWYDGAKNGIGTRPSAAAVEDFIRKNGFEFTRYDDQDLDAEYHCYSWKPGICPGQWKDGLRRFWILRRKA